MTDKKVSELDEITELTDSDELYVNDGGTSKRIKRSNITVSEHSLDLTRIEEINTARLLGRSSAGLGDVEQVQLSGLALHSDPDSGDYLLIETAEGELKQIACNDIPVAPGQMGSLGSGQFLGRVDAGSGSPEWVAYADMTEEGSPTSGHKLIGWTAAGTMRTFDVGNLPTGGGGEANTISNTGAGSQVAKAKSGVDFPIRSIVGTSPITATQNTDDITISVDDLPLANIADIADDRILGNVSGGSAVPAELTAAQVNTFLQRPEAITVALTGENANAYVADGLVKFRMPYAFTLSELPRASANTAPTGSGITIDIEDETASIFSTLLTIDATAKTSTTATTPAVLSTTSIADDQELSFNIDAVGSTIPGAGIKVTLIGYQQ